MLATTPDKTLQNIYEDEAKDNEGKFRQGSKSLARVIMAHVLAYVMAHFLANSNYASQRFRILNSDASEPVVPLPIMT
jgi:hypothetical protein